MSIDKAGKAVSRARKSVNPSPWMLKRVIRLARRAARSRQALLRRGRAPGSGAAALRRRSIGAMPDARCREAREQGVRQAHAGERAGGRQQSGPERTADERADDRRHRQDEADRDAGEAGQDEEDGLRDDVDAAATDRGEAQACVPEKREGEDCRDDPNERSPCFEADPARRIANECAAPDRRSRDAASRDSSRRRSGLATAGSGGRLGRELVLGLEVKIAGVVALMQLTCKIAVGLVHDAPTLHRRPRGDRVGPAQHVLVILHA